MASVGQSVTVAAGWGYTLTDGCRFLRSDGTVTGIVYAVDRGRLYVRLPNGDAAWTVPNAVAMEAPRG